MLCIVLYSYRVNSHLMFSRHDPQDHINSKFLHLLTFKKAA